MKKIWTENELKEHFSITSKELELIANKAGSTRLGFAILLKSFQFKGLFPISKYGIPHSIIDCIANQLKLKPKIFRQYKWSGRTFVFHRAQIREYFGFAETTTQLNSEIKEWILSNIKCYEKNTVQAAMYKKYRDLRIIPPTPARINRIVSSIMLTYEKRFLGEIYKALSVNCIASLDLLIKEFSLLEDHENSKDAITFNELKSDPGRIGLESVFQELKKLYILRGLKISASLFSEIPLRILKKYKQKISSELLGEIKRHPLEIKYSLLSIFFWLRKREIIDNLVDLFISVIHKIDSKAVKKVEREILKDIKKVHGKYNILKKITELTLDNPDGIIKDVIFPVFDPDLLQDLLKDLKTSNYSFRKKVYAVMKNSYSRHYRRMIPKFLDTLEFKTNNTANQAIIEALKIIKKFSNTSIKSFVLNETLPLTGIITTKWKNSIAEKDEEGNEVIGKINYEIRVLQALREKLRCKEIWVVGAEKYQNPEKDLPSDFEENREEYYELLNQPISVEFFINSLKDRLTKTLQNLNRNIPENLKVKISSKKGGRIIITPFESQKEPVNLSSLKNELMKKWPMINLLDILKETDFFTEFTSHFKSTGTRENFDKKTLRRRLIITLYGLGTNTGLKRVAKACNSLETYDDLRYIKRKYITKENLRDAIVSVVNKILKQKSEHIWGEGTSCASDSKKFGSWDQNLMTEWHIRYHGRGIMIYWHVDKNSTCIYSQLKSCSSSEVAAMIEGVLKHCTDLKLDRNYVDTHGQSEVAFAFSHFLDFSLMPRFKNINKQKLYIPDKNMIGKLSNIEPVLTRHINWKLISEQYDHMIKYTTALKTGSAETETIMKRFSRNNCQNSTYKALQELGKVIKTIFLCEYIMSEELRIEINEGLNVVENWNSANSFIFYGKSGEIQSNNLEDQELSVLSLHLLQNCLVYINTLMIQEILSEKEWIDKMQIEDFRALTPLIYQHVNPYGIFELNMDERLPLNIT